MKKFAMGLIILFAFLYSPLYGDGLSLKDLRSLKSLGYKDSDLIEVIKKKKISFSLTDGLRKELEEKDGFSKDVIEAIESSMALSLDQVIKMSQKGTSDFEIIKKIRGAGLVLSPTPEVLTPLIQNKVASSVIFALTHKKGALTFGELKKLLEQKASSEAVLFLFKEVDPPLKLTALQSAELLQAGAKIELVKALREVSYTKNEKFNFKIAFPHGWKITQKETIADKMSLLKAQSPEERIYLEIRSQKAKAAIDFGDEKGKKLFQKIIGFFQGKILGKMFDKLDHMAEKGKKVSFKAVKVGGCAAIQARYKALAGGDEVHLLVYYVSTNKGLYILWAVYGKKFAAEAEKTCQGIFESFDSL